MWESNLDNDDNDVNGVNSDYEGEEKDNDERPIERKENSFKKKSIDESAIISSKITKSSQNDTSEPPHKNSSKNYEEKAE